ncbi:MAG: HD domain-containing protein [Chloroflexota bacterium]|nr:MAG: HD domain-containing protein [Chloroflexota bacterium]
MNNPRLFDAIEFAARAHRGQFRKASPLPYILHPLSVARILIECDASEEIVIAALLHDVVEDTNVTLEQVRGAFGDNVARLVQGMSEPNRKDTWENRKRGTLEFLETAPQDILLIELADKLDNIREIGKDIAREGDVVWQRFNRGRDQQAWLYEQFADLFLRRMQNECGISLARQFQENVNAIFRTETGRVAASRIDYNR